ncbi:MAG: hypothetical protein F2667_02000 [Actinobacteria bacterium]|uniref:Unannotated protein n=1 Tax=freshwater metagenome TaxID=449393 RepID=A0A6J6P1R5_9ZZZZ|nr:hypothetical protein [Actinomycetota bacterium]
MLTSGLGGPAEAGGGAPPGAERAARPDRPVAIAVTRGGTTYVGSADGGSLARISGEGRSLSRVRLVRDGPVVALAATSAGNVWVDQGVSVSLVSPRGRTKRSFDLAEPEGCALQPSRYGGIAAAGRRLYVASACRSALDVYTREGVLRASVPLPGGLPRGVAWGRAQAGQPARVFVTMPDNRRLVAYDASDLREESVPLRTLKVAQPRRGHRPVPTGVVADRWGQVVVADAHNHALYVYDANHAFSHYRTLGHPPRSRGPGTIAQPVALAQHVQDGKTYAGNLFIADAGRARVQRWDTLGRTYWSRGVRLP